MQPGETYRDYVIRLMSANPGFGFRRKNFEYFSGVPAHHFAGALDLLYREKKITRIQPGLYAWIENPKPKDDIVFFDPESGTWE